MNKTQSFTPGPWIVDLSDPCRVLACDARATIICVVSGPHSNESAKADAALIASAPDLLAERDLLKAQVEELRGALERIITEAQREDANPASSCNRIADRAIDALAKVRS